MTETENQERIAFWLLPAEEESRLLKEIINRLAKQLHAPTFQPHLTLAAIPSVQIGDPEFFLKQLTATTATLQLEYSGTPITSKQYNQALILPCNLSPELAALVSTIHPQHLVPDDYLPHVSLLYANLEQKTGQRLCQEIRLEKRTLHFNKIAVIKIGQKTTSAEDVLSWQVIASRQLREKES